MSEIKWIGKNPTCDFCERDLEKTMEFIDGKTSLGPWALMCPHCYMINGVGIGIGLGQRYDSTTKELIEGA